MTAVFAATLALWQREVLRFVRQRSRIIGSLATPLLFWVLIGGGLGDAFRDPSGLSQGGYLEFFFPGTVVLSVLFTAIFSTMSVIEDRHQGFLQGVLVAPVSRASFVAAKILGGATMSLVQGGLLLALAPFIGIKLEVFRTIELAGLIFLMGAALTSLGFAFAWKIDSVQGYHGIMNTVLMPMWILSGAVFPARAGHGVFEWIRRVNPLSYGVAAFRELLAGAPVHTLGLAVVVMGAFLLVTAGVSVVLVEARAAA